MNRMKKLYTHCMSVFLAVMLVMVVGCKPNPKEILSRKWKPVDVQGEGITADMKANIIKEGNMMEFTQKGIFKSYAAGEGTETGTYQLSEDGKTIYLVSGGDVTVQMTIEELKHNRAIIKSNKMTLVLEPVP